MEPVDIDIDIKYLRQAMDLAWAGLGVNSPNPLVGCVIVRDDAVIGRGTYFYETIKHAETFALDEAGDAARGATLYVNLEPCNHYGRTPPCTERIISSGIKRVVYGINDPNPDVTGGGASALETAGVAVEKCSDIALIHDLEEQNRFFLTHKRSRRPYITLKAGTSLDGHIATRTHESRWVTGTLAAGVAHLLRGVYDAILIGEHTAIEDNPKLTYRPDETGPATMPDILFPVTPSNMKSPLRIVISPVLEIPLDLNVLNTEDAPTVIITSGPAPEDIAEKLRGIGVDIIRVASGDNGLDLLSAMHSLGWRGVQSVMVEGGGDTAGRFFDAGLVDEVNYFIAPKLIGGRDAVPVLGGEGVGPLSDAKRVIDFKSMMVGDDLLIRGRLRQG